MGETDATETELQSELAGTVDAYSQLRTLAMALEAELAEEREVRRVVEADVTRLSEANRRLSEELARRDASERVKEERARAQLDAVKDVMQVRICASRAWVEIGVL